MKSKSRRSGKKAVKKLSKKRKLNNKKKNMNNNNHMEMNNAYGNNQQNGCSKRSKTKGRMNKNKRSLRK